MDGMPLAAPLPYLAAGGYGGYGEGDGDEEEDDVDGVPLDFAAVHSLVGQKRARNDIDAD